MYILFFVGSSFLFPFISKTRHLLRMSFDRWRCLLNGWWDDVLHTFKLRENSPFIAKLNNVCSDFHKFLIYLVRES